jgi:hypothetical protein
MQATPQPPQSVALVSRSAQRIPQHVCPAAHASIDPHLHAPATQELPRGAQAIPQPPQLAASPMVLMHAPLQHSSIPPHGVSGPHESMQRPITQTVPGEQAGVHTDPESMPPPVSGGRNASIIPPVPASSSVPSRPPPLAHAHISQAQVPAARIRHTHPSLIAHKSYSLPRHCHCPSPRSCGDGHTGTPL